MSEKFCTAYEINAHFKGIRNRIYDLSGLVALANRAAGVENFTVLGTGRNPTGISQRFSNNRLRTVLPLSESHLTVSLDPNGEGDVDMSSCRGDRDGLKTYQHIEDFLRPEEVTKTETTFFTKQSLIKGKPAEYTTSSPVGSRFSAMLFGIDPSLLRNQNRSKLSDMLRNLMPGFELAGYDHNFEPEGLTGVKIYSDDSYSAMHSYPEPTKKSLYVTFRNFEGKSVKKEAELVVGAFKPRRVIEVAPIVMPELVGSYR